MHIADEVYTQEAGNTNGNGESMDGKFYGQEFRNGTGVAFDFDF